MASVTLKGERYDSKGRKTGDTEVELWSPASGEEVVISIGNRSAYVNAADLRAAIEHLT